MRTEPCACGGSIFVADESDDDAVRDAVRWHQQTVRHEVARLRRDWLEPPHEPEPVGRLLERFDGYEGRRA